MEKWHVGVNYTDLYHEYLFYTLQEVKEFIELNEEHNVNHCMYEIELIETDI